MKTIAEFDRLIQDEVEHIEALRNEDQKIWAVREGVTEAAAKRSKEIRSMIGRRNDEIKRLRRLAHFVEATPEEGVRMMYERLRAEVSRIVESADRYKTKPQKREYMSNAGIHLKRRQMAELEFLLE